MSESRGRLEAPQLALLLRRLDNWREQLNENAIVYERWGSFYRKTHYWLGTPATLLAVAAGYTAAWLDDQAITGALALTVALLTALVTFLRPIETFRKLQEDSKRCAKVASDIGALSLQIKTYGDDDGTIWEKYQELRGLAACFIDQMDSVPRRFRRRFEEEMREEEGSAAQTDAPDTIAP